MQARSMFAGLLTGLVLVLGGCGNFAQPRPDPGLLDRVEIPYTEGIPDESPLTEVRTEGLSDEEIHTARIYRSSIRAVVNVTSLSAYRGLRSGATASGGSGFIIGKQGVVVTNHHVVAGAQRLIVTLYDGSHYRAEVVGSDPELDLALLRFDPQGRDLWTLSRGDSNALQVGQTVLALGNPFGLDSTLTTGIVSALNRPIELPSGFIVRDFIQTDAAINPGNSGGPLLDRHGRVIGINTMMVSPSAASAGLGFAVPINAAAPAIHELFTTGRVTRGWIEIEGIALDARLARAGEIAVREGILVTRVNSGSNAEAAGLQDGRSGRQVRYGRHLIPVEGDVIIAIGGNRVTTAPELLAELTGRRPGETVTLTFVRNGERKQTELTLASRPE